MLENLLGVFPKRHCIGSLRRKLTGADRCREHQCGQTEGEETKAKRKGRSGSWNRHLTEVRFNAHIVRNDSALRSIPERC